MIEYEIWDRNLLRGSVYFHGTLPERIVIPQDPEFNTRFGKRNTLIVFETKERDGKIIIDATRKSQRQIDYLIKKLEGTYDGGTGKENHECGPKKSSDGRN